MKKRIICLCLLAVMLISMSATAAGAYFGTGYEVVSSSVSVIKTGLKGQKLCFSDSDFKSAFAITDFKSITLTSIPSSNDGTLLLAGRRVKEGQTIKRKNVAAMVFVPASADVEEVSFSFVLENGDTQTKSECKMRFIDRINYAPKTPDDEKSSLSLTTQAEISVYGRLEGTDPEGDKLEYIIAAYPKNGSLRIIDEESGAYKYTPINGFSGYDSFVYVLRDEYGNYSEATEVGIKIVERLSAEVYADMTDRSEYNAAVAMSAMGIMSARVLGDDKYFMPDETVTRAEFVAMAMKAVGMRSDSTLTKSFFDDNSEIPASLVGYVATAQIAGIIDGKLSEKGLVFEPNKAITKNEAARIICAIKGINVGEEDEVYFENSSVDFASRGSVLAMLTMGIFDESKESINGQEEVTRANAAEYLYRLIKNK